MALPAWLSLFVSHSLFLKMDLDSIVLFVVVPVVVCSSLSFALARLLVCTPIDQKALIPTPTRLCQSVHHLCLLPRCICAYDTSLGVIVLAVVATSAPLPLRLSDHLPTRTTCSPCHPFHTPCEFNYPFCFHWITKPTFHPQPTVNSLFQPSFHVSLYPGDYF